MGKDGGGGGAEPTYYYRGPSQSEYDKLQSERDQLKARVVDLESENAALKESYRYEVVIKQKARIHALEVLVREVIPSDFLPVAYVRVILPQAWLTRARKLVGEG